MIVSMAKESKKKVTPLIQQYLDIKDQYQDTIVLFQVGDFYELFFEDAVTASKFLCITLTKRGTFENKPIPLCGVPVHTVDHYIAKLVKGGFKVALCNQLEEAQAGKVVDRGVVRVFTPGTLTQTQLLDEKSASYIFSFFPSEDKWGLLFGELMTGQLFATQLDTCSKKEIETELIRFFPDEIIIPKTKQTKLFQTFFKKLGYFTTVTDIKEFHDQEDKFNAWLQKQFKNNDNIQKSDSLKSCLQVFYAYMSKTQKESLSHFETLHMYSPEDFLLLDAATLGNLEIIKNKQDGTRKNTLLSLVDKAMTPMGSRMIKKWLMRPLVKQKAIESRLDVVDLLVADVSLLQQLKEFLHSLGDLERTVGRIALQRATLSDYKSLMQSLFVLPHIVQIISEYKNKELLSVIINQIGTFSTLRSLLVSALNQDVTVDWIIKKGFHEKLDYIRELVENSSAQILELEKREQQKTGINSLKIRYNKVHGYYVEVTKANMHLVPGSYERKQTLVGRERFSTKELRQLQDEIVRAKTESISLEKELFDEIKQNVFSVVALLKKTAYGLAYLDGLIGFANVSYDYSYIRPTFNSDRNIMISKGCHPVVQAMGRSRFVPNDTVLSDEQSLFVITGPNMGGKSTYLRQVALISVMAQCGMFVPAKSACLSLLDRVFTRIGAGDNLAEGKSTFLVEMEETALICSWATKNSLVILDEVGRGTSTFDGLAIARAVIEYIYNEVQARCLFATHYHELTTLEKNYSGIKSFYLESKQTKNGITFLHTMVQGAADSSFGLEVAKLAKLPDKLIERAQTVLYELKIKNNSFFPAEKIENNELLERIVALEDKIKQQENVLHTIKNIDYNDLSPKKAFDILWKINEQSSS